MGGILFLSCKVVKALSLNKPYLESGFESILSLLSSVVGFLS